MLKRIGFLALLAATLTACGGGSGEGLSYGSPSVEVAGLTSDPVTVELAGTSASLNFTEDDKKTFSHKVANNNAYTLKLSSDDTTCKFTENGRDTITSKVASATHKVGCGIDAPTTPEPGDPDDPEARYFQVTMSRGGADNPVDKDHPAEVRVTLYSPSGSPLSGERVTFGSTHGVLSRDSWVTNGSGQVVLELKAGATPGAGVFTATHEYKDGEGADKTVFITRNFATNGNQDGASVPVPTGYSLTLSIAGGASEASPSQPLTVTARLSTTGTASVSGIPVRFSSEVGVLNQSSALTNAAGEATVILSDGETKGAGWLRATVDIGSSSLSEQVGVATRGEATGLPVEGDPVVITASLDRGAAGQPIDKNHPGNLQVTVTRGGQPLAGEVVSFSANLLSVTPGTALTDSAGRASVQLQAGSDSGAGSVMITVEPKPGQVYQHKVNFSVVGENAATNEYTITPVLVGGVGSAATPVSKSQPGTLQVTVLRDGVAAPGEVVTFAPALGGLSQTSALTDNSGQVSVQVLAGAATGAGAITVTVAGQTATVNVAYQGDVPVDDGYLLEIVSINNSVGAVTANNAITAQDPATVTVRLTHSGGGNVADKLVEVATTLGVLDGSGVNEGSQSASLMTDANGEVTFELRPAGVSGGGLVTARATVGSGVEAESKAFVIHLQTVGDVFLEPLRLLDPVLGARRDVPSDGYLRVEAQVTGADVANKVVAFTLNGPTGVGELDPISGTALTDTNGVATIKLLPGSAMGASIITATVRIGWEGEQESASQSATFYSPGGGSTVVPEVVDLALSLEQAGAQVTTVNEGQTVLLKVALTSAGNPWLGEAYVEFDSRCMAAGQATINGTNSPAPVAAWSGEAQAVYVPTVGCTSDVIAARATIGSETLMDTQNLTVMPASGASIEFVGATPNVLGLKGSALAGAPETSVLTFLVKNTNGQPVSAGTDVQFEVTGNMGGFAITSDTTVPTNSAGEVTVTVRSGSVPGVAGVKAALVSDLSVFTTGHLSIHSGVVTQDRFVIAAERLNPGAWNHLGETVQISARAADRFGNWVPDGTRINFVTELGDIQGSCETVSGGCSVTWTSQGAQPGMDAAKSTRACESDGVENYKQGTVGEFCAQADRPGRSTILAWTVGEESFRDSNGNNLFDVAELSSRTGLPEAFLDTNETGVYDASIHEFIDYNQSGDYDGVSATFRGVGCSADAVTSGHCEDLIHVRRSAVIALSTDAVDGIVIGTVSATTGGTFVATMMDKNGNAPIVGSSISIEVGKGAKVFGESSCTVPSTTEPYSCTFRVLPSEDDPATDPISEPILVKFQSAAAVPPVIYEVHPQ